MLALKLIKIAFKNVFRNKRRTLLTLGVLTAGGAGMLVMGGFFINLIGNLGEKIIHGQSGHLQIHRAGYYRFGATDPLAYLMSGTEGIRTRIEKLPHVLYTVPRLTFSGMLSTDKTSLAVSVTGCDPSRERQMGSFQANNAKIPSIAIAEGRDLDENRKEEALVGLGLMKALDLKIGDWVMLLTTREQGAVDGNRFRIVGVFETAMRESDSRTMKINLTAAQEMIGAPGQLHSLQAILDRTENTESVRSAAIGELAKNEIPLEIMTWEEMSSYYRQGRSLFEKIFIIISLVFGTVFFFSAGNSVNMSLMERTREFGTMMAMGNGRAAILTVILLEAGLIGIIGGLLSMLLGTGLGTLISAIGIEMPPTPNASTGFLAVISITPMLMAKTFALTFVSSFLAALVPAYRTARIPVVDALNHV